MALPSRMLSLVALALAGFTYQGCAVARFKPYVGAQQNWPTAPGAFVENKYAVPAYFSPPPRPYNVLGYLDATTAPIRRKGVVAFAARRAKEVGGDAIVVLQEDSEYVGTYSSGSAYTTGAVTGSYAGRTTYGPGYASTTGNIYGRGYATTSASSFSVPMFAGKASVLIIKFK
jgi:hypothetical protein